MDNIHFIVLHYKYFPFYQFLNYVFHASLLLLHFAETRTFMIKVLLPGALKRCLSICSDRNSYTPEKSLLTLSSSDVNMGGLLYKKYTLVQSQTTFLAFKIDSNLLINLDCGTIALVNILIAMLRIKRCSLKFLQIRKTTLYQLGVFVISVFKYEQTSSQIM